MEEAARSKSPRVLVTGKAALPHPVPGVGLIPGRDLGFDQGAQELLGVPPLGAGGDQEFGGQAAHRGELEPAQPGGQVGGQRRRCRAHWSSPPKA